MDKKIAIVVLNWNSAGDTIECLESVLMSDFKNYKVFLVDNGSKDDLLKKLKEVNLKKVEVMVNKSNLGFALANNLIAKKILDSGFDYFMILNNDTIIGKKVLFKLFRLMEGNDKIGVASPIVFDYQNKTSLGGTDSPGRFNLKKGGGEPWVKNLQQIKLRKKPFFVDYTSASCWMIRSDMVSKTGLFNEKFFAYGEEIDLALRIQKEGYRFVIDPTAKIWHKGAASSQKVTGFKIRHSARNMIWLERIHATKKEYFSFMINLFFVKFPKTFGSSFFHKKGLQIFLSYLKGLFEGLFVKREKFNNPEYYKI